MASGVGFSFVAVFTVLFLYILFCFFVVSFLFRQCRFIGCPTRWEVIDSISDEELLLPSTRPQRTLHDRRNALILSDVNSGFNADIIPTVNLVRAGSTDYSQEEEEDEEEEEEEGGRTYSENVRPSGVEELETPTRLISRLSTSTSPFSVSSTEISPDPRVRMVRSLSIPNVRLRHVPAIQDAKLNLNFRKLTSQSLVEAANITVNETESHLSANMPNRRNSESDCAPDPILATREDAASPRPPTVLADMLSDQTPAGILLDQGDLCRREEGNTRT
ncbi:hypothetical protein V1525DRAFT_395404 [Lipomyces kononenkoae]|uniref:Uncharacterized protein n=1 Tax=Lipomyces kononenkoae TaxID=34357 RepID=A0ACC3TAK6_LIPKO